MKKNKIIALVLSIILIYGLCLYGLSMLDYYRAIKDNDFASISFSFTFYFTPAIYIFNLIALFQFIISKFRKSTLLRISLLQGIFSFVIFFPIWTTNSFFIIDPDRPQLYDALFIARYVLSFLIAAFNVFSLRYLVSTITPQLIPFGDGSMTFDEVNKWQRFFHRIFDLIIISVTIYPSFDYIGRFLVSILEHSNFLASTVGRLLELDRSHYILAYFFITLYYLVTEGVFNTSIGKTILGNLIVDNNAGRPNLGQRIGRTFARLIPFEAFSFIFLYRGWHDSLTQTYIVKSEKFLKNEND
ncbi:RDD family protein [Pedobacter sp. 22226]|uniref:RDD family protein n=1 Tax=Pedobacter sp. 22226 TaxID=3453894 RepID=UPI003F841486